MKKTKKRNCKHGLDDKQEIQARRIKDILTGKTENPEKKKEYIDKLTEIYNSCCAENEECFVLNEIFEKYLKEKDLVLYSAYVRAGYHVADFV